MERCAGAGAGADGGDSRRWEMPVFLGFFSAELPSCLTSPWKLSRRGCGRSPQYRHPDFCDPFQLKPRGLSKDWVSFVASPTPSSWVDNFFNSLILSASLPFSICRDFSLIQSPGHAKLYFLPEPQTIPLCFRTFLFLSELEYVW